MRKLWRDDFKKFKNLFTIKFEKLNHLKYKSQIYIKYIFKM